MRQRVPLLKALTGLRFIAAAMIVLVHIKIKHYPELAFIRTFNLSQAVSFFFVLSGFILTYTYQRLEKPEVAAFLMARFSRLWPAHIFTLVMALVMFPRLLTKAAHAAPLLLVPITQAFMLHSLVPMGKFYFSLNNVAWSISTEFFFYLCFPFLSRLNKKNLLKAMAVALVVIAALACLGQWLNLPVDSRGPSLKGLLYISPLSRILEFIAGILLCRIFLDKNPSATVSAKTAPKPARATFLELGILAGTLGVMFLSNWQPVQKWLLDFNAPLSVILGLYGFTLPAFCCVIYVMAQGKGWISRFLGTAPLVFLGEISYALYLCHQLFIKKFPAVPFPLLWICLLTLSTLIYFGVEKPGRKLLLKLFRKISPSPTVPPISSNNVTLPDAEPLRIKPISA